MKDLTDIVNESSQKLAWSIYDEDGDTEVVLKMKQQPKYFRVCTSTPVPEIVFSVNKYDDDNNSEWHKINWE